ncbi:Sec-independent protein secretion pathway component TatC [Evansella vedderi]|uniref:Sec-independent protein secretion pathway component TatC n=1 Tax=Evansella vedderi TaxID=38282 RepID=A0ABU0A2G2_9BACI|nr:hypothetical protein [Evansella vedderi]MDQ0257187.1 Sec-independent protein secretion pathway component TatC [Evansella vedderi]
MNSLLFFPIYIFPIIAAVAFGYYTTEQQKEKDLILKLAGYFLLGTVLFWYAWLPIPIGLAIGHFILKPKTNATGKKRVLYIGTLVALLSHLLIF